MLVESHYKVELYAAPQGMQRLIVQISLIALIFIDVLWFSEFSVDSYNRDLKWIV